MRDLAIAMNNQRKVIANRDAAILVINQRVEGPLAELDRQIKTLTDQLRAWAEANPDQFPRDRKSLDLVSGTLGFDTNPPRVALLNRSWNWEKVLKAVKDRARAFLRMKEEVNKELMLSHYKCAKDKPGFVSAVFAPIGVRVLQEEQFYAEPDLTKVETRQTQEAA